MSQNLRMTEAEFEIVKKRLKHAGSAVITQEAKTKKWRNEEDLSIQLEATGLPSPTLEYRFAPPRRWRFDLAWPTYKLAVEVDGMVHRIKQRFISDLEKHQVALAAGWSVLRVSPKQVRNGEATELIRRIMLERYL